MLVFRGVNIQYPQEHDQSHPLPKHLLLDTFTCLLVHFTYRVFFCWTPPLKRSEKCCRGSTFFFPGFTHRMVKYSCFFSFSNGRILIPWWSWPKMFGIWNVHTLTWGIIQTLINFDDYCFQRVVQPPTRIWFQHQQKTLQTPILLDVRDAVHGNDLKPLKSSAGKRYPANLQSATKIMLNVLHSWSSSISFTSNLFWKRPRPGVTKQDSVHRLVSVCTAHRHTLHLAQWRQHHEPLQSCQRRGQKWFRWKVFSCGGLMVERTNTTGLLESRARLKFVAGIVFVWFLCDLSLVTLYFLPFPKSNLDLIAKYINNHLSMVVATSFADFCY